MRGREIKGGGQIEIERENRKRKKEMNLSKNSMSPHWSVGEQDNPSEDEGEGDHKGTVQFFSHSFVCLSGEEPPRWSGLRALRKRRYR